MIPDDLQHLLELCSDSMRFGFSETAKVLWLQALAHPEAAKIPQQHFQEMEKLMVRLESMDGGGA